jgi:putative ABC transport system permease protein
LAARTRIPPADTASAIINAVQHADRSQPIADVLTMDDLIHASISSERFNMLLLVAFAGLALILAGVGIYSVLAYGVRRRMREIGIRMALGAQVRDVVRMVLVDGLKPTIFGLVLGLAGALMLGRVMANLVFGVRTSDPLTFAAVSLLLGFVALLASVIPAYRATRVDPVIALRDE